MSYLVVENFKLGLDTRKFWLSAPPGSLTTLENAHITQGGEIEKRKAFSPFPTMPAGTFGLQAISGGLCVFGSTDLATSFPIALGTTSINYRRCQHPVDNTKAMTAVRCSEQFGGKAFVAATFADGRTFCFYENSAGTMVAIRAFYDGLIIGTHTAEQVATEIAAALTASLPSGYVVAASGTNVSVKTPYKVPAELEATATTVGDGDLTVDTIGDAVEPTSASQAVCTMTFTEWDTGNGVNQITAPGAGGTGTISLLAAAVEYSQSAEATVLNLVLKINENITTPKYTAKYEESTGGGIVTIYGPSTSPASYNAKSVVVDYDSGITVASSVSSNFKVEIASGGAHAISVSSGSSRTLQTTELTTLSVSGTIYNKRSYEWLPVDGVNDGIIPTAPNKSSTLFKSKSSMTPGTTLTKSFFCRVTDYDTDSSKVPRVADSLTDVSVVLKLTPK